MIFVSSCGYVHMSAYLHRLHKRALDSHGIRVTGSCDTHNIFGRNLTWIFWNDDSHYLTTDSSLQDLSLFFKYFNTKNKQILVSNKSQNASSIIYPNNPNISPIFMKFICHLKI